MPETFPCHNDETFFLEIQKCGGEKKSACALELVCGLLFGCDEREGHKRKPKSHPHLGIHFVCAVEKHESRRHKRKDRGGPPSNPP